MADRGRVPRTRRHVLRALRAVELAAHRVEPSWRTALSTGDDVTPPEAFDAWKAVRERIVDGLALAGVDDDTGKIMMMPERILEVAVPIHRDDGSTAVFT